MSALCYTGHRPNKLNGYKAEENKELIWRIHDATVDFIQLKNVDTIISGMALGVDIWGAKIALKLKEKYPNLKLICAIPCKNHSSKWNKIDQEVYEDVLSKADQVIYVSEEDYAPYLMQKRNEWMVNRSKYVIGVWDGTDGGTKNCVKYAEKQGHIKEIYTIKP